MIVFSLDLMAFVCSKHRNGSWVGGGSGSEKFSDEICGWFRDPPVVGRSLVRKKETGRSCKESWCSSGYAWDYYSLRWRRWDCAAAGQMLTSDETRRRNANKEIYRRQKYQRPFSPVCVCVCAVLLKAVSFMPPSRNRYARDWWRLILLRNHFFTAHL